MVSKGVDYYGYINQNQYSVAFSGPEVGSTLYRANNFTQNNLQIESGNMSGYTGTYRWTATGDGSQPTPTAYNEISSLTGNLEGGSMTVMLNTPSMITSQSTICYGFFDAGAGLGGLTNQDQSYVYFTNNNANWMTYLVNHYGVGNQPFYKLALPGAHDAGMFTLDTVNALLASPEGIAFILALAVVFPPLAGLTLAGAPNAVTNLGLTQKENITQMLNVGVRYFDFRPGTCYPAVIGFSDARYHQHAVIPGYAYISFLQDVLTWLMANPGEIVVVNCNTQGFASSAMNPTPQQLDEDLQAAMSATGCNNSIKTGDKSSLGQSISSLLASNTRLIFLNQIAGETTKYDSYSSSAYATLTPGPIVNALAGMTTAGQQGYDYTVLQLQGTCTALTGVQAAAMLTLSQTSSPLMSTKANFDTATLPWLLSNVTRNLTADKLVVFLNDFADNATVDTAITVSRARMGLR